MKNIFALCIAAIFVASSGCSTDFEVTGEFKEFAVVYGLLDMADNPSNGGAGHNIRIQKSFLGEIDAAIMAANPDSSYFKYDDLVVSLVGYNESGNEVSNTMLDTTTLAGKDTSGGFGFFGPEQRVYHTNQNLEGGFDYELLIHNTVTGYRDSAQILMIDRTGFTYSSPNQNTNNPQSFAIYNSTLGYRDKTIRFNLPEGVKAGEIWLRLYYREILDASPGVEEVKFIDWQMEKFKLDDPAGVNAIYATSFSGESLYSFIGSSLDPIAGQRIIGREDIDQDGHTQDLDLFVHIAGKDLSDYIEINAPSNSGALTDKPTYSNMAVGKGVFSSRSTVFFPNDIWLDPASSVFLQGGEHTDNLNFTTD